MGRGGTDLSATLLARALNARRVVLWKDVPGILTADPRLVPDARLIPQLHHREAGEVAHYGAKVLHPRALIPIAGTRVEMHVRSFLNPDAPGTEVSARRSLRAYPVKALAIVRGQAIVTVAGKGMAGVHGIAARTFSAVESERLSVSTIFQASSESSIGFTLPESEAERAVRSIQQAFSGEIASGLIDNVTAKPGMAVIAVVGDGMAGTPGIAARVFSALATAHINVVAIAQGSSERNISFAVNGDDAAEAARCVHAAFQLSKIGGGRAAATVQDRRRAARVRPGRPRAGRSDRRADAAASRRSASSACSIGRDTSSSRAASRGAGCSISRRRRTRGALLASLGGRKATAAEALTTMAGACGVAADHRRRDQRGDRRPAADGDRPRLQRRARQQEAAGRRVGPLRGAARDRRRTADRSVKYEATVGAGLPIIDTYHKLVETGDRVLRIEGCVSGTLMYIMSAVSQGERFSEAVRRAVEKGYAEPDAREDLSGMDAARKGLILARLLGYRGPAPVPHEPGAAARSKAVSLEQFFERAAEVRQGMGGPRRAREASRGGCCATSSRRRRGRCRRSWPRCRRRARWARSRARAT